MKGNGKRKGKNGKARAAGRTAHSEADKARFVELARAQGQRAAAKAAGVHVQTIGNWSKAAQRMRRSRQAAPPARVEPPMVVLASAHDLRKSFVTRAAAAPPTNGNGSPASGILATLDGMHAELSATLERVDRLRAAFRGIGL